MVLKCFRDLKNMSFKIFMFPIIERTAPSWWEPLRNPKKIDGIQQLNPYCDNTDHWGKLPHVATALLTLWMDTFGLSYFAWSK